MTDQTKANNFYPILEPWRQISDTKTFDAYRSGFWAYHYDRFIAWKTGRPQRTERVTYTAVAYVKGNVKMRLDGAESGPHRIKRPRRRWRKYLRPSYWWHK